MQGLQKIATKTAGQDPKQLGPSPIEIQFKMKIGDCHMKLKNLKLAHQTVRNVLQIESKLTRTVSLFRSRRATEQFMSTCASRKYLRSTIRRRTPYYITKKC
jgi:hypothetical protein